MGECMKTRKQLFYDWQNKTNDIQMIAGFFQNDFKQMIEDGYLTLEQIESSRLEMYTQVSKFIKEINVLLDEYNQFVLTEIVNILKEK